MGPEEEEGATHGLIYLCCREEGTAPGSDWELCAAPHAAGMMLDLYEAEPPWIQ